MDGWGRGTGGMAGSLRDWVGSALVALIVGGAWGWLTERWAVWSPATVVLLVVVAATAAAAFMLARRSVVLAGAVLVIVALVAGGVVLWVDDDAAQTLKAADDCGRKTTPKSPEVVVVWEGEELADFCAVVAAFDDDVEVTSVGEEISGALAARIDSRDVPDVALIPQPSLVHLLMSHGRLCPIDAEVAERMPDQWRAMTTGGEAGNAPEYTYGTFVKGVDKSLFWYRAGAIEDQVPERWRWADLTRWVSAAVDDGSGVAPLAVPAADRWPLTDWFENQLADRAPDLYRRLSSGQEPNWGRGPDRDALVGVLDDMAGVWAVPGVFPAGDAAPAETSWRDVGRRLDDGQAQLAFAPSVVAGAFRELPRNVRPRPIGFPGRAGQGPRIVGGDIAVVLQRAGSCRGTTVGQELVDWLTDVEAITAWADRDPGYLTPNLRSPLTPGSDPSPDDDVRSVLTDRLQNPPGGELFFDLSDDRFAVANDGDTTVTWDILADFFENVTTGNVSRTCAIDQTIARLAAAYRGDRPSTPTCDT